MLAGQLPLWNPWLNGGQPILSNPNYSAFYPPTWLVLPLQPAYGLSALVLLHAGIAFAGAWRLARHLGAERGAAALAAIGYSGCGAILSLLNVFPMFCGMAWFPWVMTWGDAALRASGTAWRRPALLAGAALAMQMLNGEPGTVTMSGLGLLALAAGQLLSGDPALRRRAVRVVAPPLVAAALAAVQIAPTVGRFGDSPRAHGLTAVEATRWSTPPSRLVELLWPRFFGDPAGHAEGLFLGGKMNDQGFPYVATLYPGLAVTLLAAAALCLWPVPRRAAWLLCVAAGGFLAPGRFNPLYEAARRLLLPLAAQRFPERFAVLAVAPLAFAAALGWQRLLDERRAGRPQAAELPLALGLVTLAIAATLTGVLYGAPAVAVAFLRDHQRPPVTPASLALGVTFLRREAWAALATAAAASAWFAACRWRRPAARWLTVAGVVLLAADLWHYGHGLVRAVPAADYARRPGVLDRLDPVGQPLFVETFPEERQLPLPRGDVDRALVRATLDRLLPYSAALWKVPYVLNEDFDRMLTAWGAQTLRVLHAELARQPDLAFRVLGAWGVQDMLLRASTAAGVPERAPPPDGPEDGPAPVVERRAMHNPYTLATFRFVPRVSFHPSFVSALYIAHGEGYEVATHENCPRPGRPPQTIAYRGTPQALELGSRPSRLDLHYRAPGGAFFVAATTFDDGWHAAVDGVAQPLYPTELGQIGVELPAGEHRLSLDYRDPLLALGAAITLAALCAVSLLAAAAGRRLGEPR